MLARVADPVKRQRKWCRFDVETGWFVLLPMTRDEVDGPPRVYCHMDDLVRGDYTVEETATVREFLERWD